MGAGCRFENQVFDGTSNVGLIKLCSSLNIHLGTGRVSLRTSSVLVNRAARAYKEEADKLYRDCKKLNEEMIHRSRRLSIKIIIDSDSDFTEEDTISEKENGQNCEEILRNSNSEGNHSDRKRKNPYHNQRNRSERNDLGNNKRDTNKASKSSSATKELALQTETNRNQRNQSERNYLGNNKRDKNKASKSSSATKELALQTETNRNQRNQSERNDLGNIIRDKNKASKSSSATKEIGLQTAEPFISDRRKKYCPENPNIDENQPFGLVMVFDKNSPVPRKIIWSKINV